MKNYIPFLKTKTNEFSAIKNLDDDIAMNITPFFDIHRKTNHVYTEEEYKSFIIQRKKKFQLNANKLKSFYIDDYDIPDELFIDNKQGYFYVLGTLLPLPFIPVIGINRSDERNNVVLKNKDMWNSDTVALRVSYEDILSGVPDIFYLTKNAEKIFPTIELIIDFRVIEQNINIDILYANTEKFLQKIKGKFSKIIITGSSISEIVSDYIRTETRKDIPRKELELFKKVTSNYSDLYFGDYTVVSPNYSEADIPDKLMQKLTTAKVTYPHDDFFYICRGSSLEKKGNNQYKNFCRYISEQSFFRGENYSNGDYFINNALKYPKNITPGSILNPTINAHISYMYKDYQL